MKLNRLVMIFSTVTFAGFAAYANQCKDIFFKDPFSKQVMQKNMSLALLNSVQNLTESTTGARIEKKWTLSTHNISMLIDQLGKDLYQDHVVISARDKVKLGTRNVTHTVYLDQFKLNLKESGFKIGPNFDLTEVTMKPRIRKYGTIPTDRSVSLDNVEFAEFTKDYSFVEFKFPDARFNGAVFKPRIYMADKYIQMFGTPEFVQNFDLIMKETKSLDINKSTPETVEAMLHFFLNGQQQGASFGKVAVNLYERISYAVDFNDNKSFSKFQIQMTLDKSISLLVYELGKTIEAYKPEHSVIEVKIPVEYAHVELLKDSSSKESDKMKKTLAAIPGYENFLKFVSSVQKAHLKNEYMEGVGKNGHGHRGYLRAIGDTDVSALSKIEDLK